MSTSARRNRKTSSTPAVALERTIQHLVVMRESNAHDRILMLGMIQQTLEKYSHLPGARMLLEAGMDVYDNPERYGAVSKRLGKSRVVLIEVEDVLYMYSMGSAAVSDDDRDANAFVSELVNLIEQYRPREVCAVAFTRFVRSAQFTGDLLRAMTEHVEVVSCETEIRPATPEGAMLFGFLAIIASLEREYIVRRHTAGRVAQWKRGVWITHGVPPGYRVTEDRRLVLDHSQVETTRAMLVILADGSLSVRSKVERLAQLGVSTPKIRERHGPNATIADARNPSEAIRTLEGWADSLRRGRYEVPWTNPFPGVDHIAGVAVEPRDGYKNGVLHFPYELELPTGGWADEATFEAIERNARSATTGGAAHRTTTPLSGMFRFREDGDEFALLSPGRHYELRRRPEHLGRKHPGWSAENSDPEQRTIATIDRVELHHSITNVIIRALREGLPAELDYGRFLASAHLGPIDGNKARMRALRTQITQAEEDLRRARRNAQLASEDDAALGFIDDCKRHHATLKGLRTELADLEAAAAAPQLEDEFESSAEMAVFALAALGESGRSVPKDVSEALRAVITNERLHVHDEVVTWSLDLELPHPEGTVVLGPITGTVRNRRRSSGPPGPMSRSSRERRRRALADLGLSAHVATVAAGCPYPDLLAALQAHHLDQPVPEGLDPAWVDLVAAIYIDPLRWDKSRWRFGEDDHRQDIFDALAAAGGSVPLADLRAAGFDPEQLRYLMREIATPTGASVLRKDGRGPTASYRLLDCPHCGALLSRSCLTPETPEGLLCPACLRTPSAESPIFPAWYLDRHPEGVDRSEAVPADEAAA